MRRSIILVAAIFMLLGGCRSEGKRDAAFPNAPVILISIDTLRSDHLPIYGYDGVATPAIDRFRQDAILARAAWSHSPMTLPSHLSMLTGLAPAEHGVRNNIGYRFHADAHAYLPCLLRDRGYATGAAVSSYVLRSESGIDACFDEYEDSIDPRPGAEFAEYQRPGSETARAALEWIAAQGNRPFFHFFHIYEPHVPYDPPEPFRSRYSSAYDGEIAHADAIVGAFLDELRKSGVYDRALIILTSDHGEGLGDHGEEQHSILLYREAIAVPLLIKLPRNTRRGEEIARNVALKDLTPTMLRALSVELPAGMARHSILEDLPDDAALVFAETMYPRIHLGWSDLASLIRGNYHYIHGPKPELYDLARDPAERNDLSASERREVARFRDEIAPLLVPLQPLEAIDPEAAKRLAALGYVGGASAPGGALPSPRDRIPVLTEFRDALALASARRYDPAIAALHALLAKDPAMAEVRLKLAETLSEAGRDREAASAYADVIARMPMLSGDILLAAGYAHLRLGEFDRAAQLADQAALDTPLKAHELRARVLAAQKRFAGAEAEARAAVDTVNPQPASMLVLAEVLRTKGDFPGALAAIDRAAERAATIGSGSVYRLEFLRGDMLAKLGRFEDARAAIDREIAAFPSHLEAYGVRAVLRLVTGDPAGANGAMEEMVRANPNRAAFEFAAKTMDALDDPESAARWRARAAKIP
ncbi:MAG: sulfatase [Thermoanaerobaculia bacterium]